MIFALLGLFKSLRGIGFFVLQFLRIASIITLMASAAGCWVLMIKVSKARTYFVFECISLFVTSIISIVLIVSELPMLKSMRNYFRNTWPVLSDSHGVGWLGLAMIVIGCNILGSLNQPAYDHHNLGDHFTSLVIAAGILSLTFGFLNILGSIIWRDGKEGITSRDIRAHGSLAKNRQSLPSYNASPASSIRNEKGRSKFASMFWKKGDAGKTFDRPIISGPFQAHQDIERNEVEPDRTSPIAPGVQRPPTAMHPMHTGRSSHYSTANMSRF